MTGAGAALSRGLAHRPRCLNEKRYDTVTYFLRIFAADDKALGTCTTAPGWAPVQLLREGRHEDCCPLQKAIDNAGYEYNLRKKELDYATRSRLP